MKVREIMTKDPACCTPTDTARDAARVMRERDCGCLPIVDADSARVVGVVTDRDLAVRALADGMGPDTRLNHLMTPVASCCGVNDDLRDVERTMGDLQVRRVPIVDADGRCVGIVAQADIARAARDAQVSEHEVAIVVERISESNSSAGRRAESARL
jgi:CBS domain-containing protein